MFIILKMLTPYPYDEKNLKYKIINIKNLIYNKYNIYLFIIFKNTYIEDLDR